MCLKVAHGVHRKSEKLTIKEIRFKVIPHKEQRYDTVGDWKVENGILNITVSEMGNWKYSILVAVHEIIEAILCTDRDIKETDIFNFDVAFEKKRKKNNTDEPGDSPLAPYRKEHRFAENIERLLCEQLGVDWNEYDKAICNG